MRYCRFNVTKCVPMKMINFQYFLDYIISYEVKSCSLDLILIFYSLLWFGVSVVIEILCLLVCLGIS